MNNSDFRCQDSGWRSSHKITNSTISKTMPTMLAARPAKARYHVRLRNLKSKTKASHEAPNLHQLLNRERSRYCLPSLKKAPSLDTLALMHAKFMAQQGIVSHPFVKNEELTAATNSRRAADNVHAANSILALHCAALAVTESKANILDQEFNEFGIGVAKGSNGKLYMCQLFRKV